MFRFLGGLIALGFVVVGLMLLLGSLVRSILRIRHSKDDSTQTAAEPPANAKVGYACPNCGATLANGAEVSPLGDVNCGYCQQWFNVFGRDGMSSTS
ncbi:MAG TPA: hypothetical protein VHB77_17620 [Planctomycetaceae bacterium]|nr:hypothetical protein [Planctomycetaceae bacterium]